MKIYEKDGFVIYNENSENIDSLIGKEVQCIMTSPPYYNLRDYEVDGQLGVENSVEGYIKNLCNIFDKCKTVLKEDGVCFVNIWDTYDKSGGLLCVPDLFKLEMIKRGWVCRNEIIWHKPNSMPSSAKNRFNHDYEKVYMFVKSKYYYKCNTQYEKRKSKTVVSKQNDIGGKYRDVSHETVHRQGMNKKRGAKLIEKRNLPSQDEFVSELRANFSKKEIIEKTGLKETTVAHWFRRDKAGFSFPKKEEWALLETELCSYLLDVYYETDDINKNQDKGRLKRAVWSINTKPSKEKHFATYPEELCETPILFGTDVGDIVLDPFCGSGTTGVVAKRLGRKFVGVELNKDYCNIIIKRMSE